MTVVDSAPVEFVRLTPQLGAQVSGINLEFPIGDRVAGALRQALHEHGLLIFEPDKTVTLHSFKLLGSCFGETEVYPYNAHDEPDAEMTAIDSEKRTISLANRWHTDGSSLPNPPQAAMLTPVVLPESGGDTLWASMYAAWDALSDRFKTYLLGLEAIHTTSILFHRAELGYPDIFGAGNTTRHPVAPRDPVTGRHFLYVNSNHTERIVGVPLAESQHVLAFLLEHISLPEFQYRLQWKPNTIAIWEERVTQHRAISGQIGRRALNRIAIKGGPVSA